MRLGKQLKDFTLCLNMLLLCAIDFVDGFQFVPRKTVLSLPRERGETAFTLGLGRKEGRKESRR